MLVSASETNAIPHNGTGYLLQDSIDQPLTIRHRMGEPFQVLSFRVAGLRRGLPASVGLTARIKGGTTSTFGAWLHGGVDGPGGLEDFQTYYSWFFTDVDELTLNGRGVALDALSVYVGPPPNRPRLWIQAIDPAAFEDPGLDMHGEPSLHHGLVGIWRLGDLSQSLTCQLSFSGTATYGADYSVVGLGFTNRTVTFAPGHHSRLLYLLPGRDSVTDDRETIEIRIDPSLAYTLDTPDRAFVTIYEDPYDAWIVNRWWGLDPNSPFGDPAADPDQGGFSNISEFVMGMDAIELGWMQQPIIYRQNDSIRVVIPYSKLARDYHYQLRTSENLSTWTPITIEPVIRSLSPSLDSLYYEIPNAMSSLFIDVAIRSTK